MLCDGLTGGRKRGGKEAQDGGDIWYGRFTLLCASGWHNIVKQLYSNKKMSPDVAKCSLRRTLLPHLLLRMLANALKLDLWLSDM